MTLRSISHGPRPSTLPAASKTPPAMSWAELARAEGHRPRKPMNPQPQISGRKITPAHVLAYVRRFGPVAARQVAAGLKIGRSNASNMLTELHVAGRVTRHGAGNSVTYEAAP